MDKTIVMQGNDALVALAAIAEARDKWPILCQVTDEEVLMLLMSRALTMEVAK